MTLRLIVMGTANAVASANRDNTWLALDSDAGLLLLDCAGSPAHRLARAGLDPARVQGVLLTHAHPDHAYGLPSLVQHLMMLSREHDLTIYGLTQTLEPALRVLQALNTLPPWLILHPLPSADLHPVPLGAGYRLLVSPVQHSIPTLGVRIEPTRGGTTVAYSSDTEPCDALVALARGVDLLIHEAAVDTPTPGHSTPEQAGQAAARCGARSLVLAHCPPELHARQDATLARVRQHYGGPARMAQEGEVFVLSGA